MFSTPQVTVYAIQPGCGSEQAARILGADTSPVFWYATAGPSIVGLCMPCTKAAWPICCDAVEKSLGKQEAGCPRQIQDTSPVAASSATARSPPARTDQRLRCSPCPGTIGTRLDRSLQHCYRSLRNRRLADHLLRERHALFTFLNCPGLEPRTGEQNRPSGRWQWRARSGVEIARPEAHRRKAFWSAFCKPAASNSSRQPLLSRTSSVPLGSKYWA